MPALAYCVDAAIPPGYALAGDCSLPTPELSGVPPVTNSSFIDLSVPPVPHHWSPNLSASLYKIDAWGAPYFAINESGHISVRPHGAETRLRQEIDIIKVLKKATDPKSAGGLGLDLPLIIRFPDVLKDRLCSLQSAFDTAIRSHGYGSHYQGVYPVKCNQDRFIVDDIVEYGRSFRFGLEAGSKPELLLAMTSLLRGSSDAFLICNGYKDASYISLALFARKMNLNSVIVLEEEDEVDLVIQVSSRLCIRPVIGLRAKLRTKHSGHFGSTSGEKGKFGLTTMQVLSVIKKLQQAEMLGCLQLLHFHIGSQIPTTDLLADGVGEATQIYCELVRLGAGMKIIDIGGGLGIDYDGSCSATSDMSVGYGMDEYASKVVQVVRDVCDRRFIAHPILCSESGRAIVSHHSVLIFEAVSASKSLRLPEFDLEHLLHELPMEAVDHYRNLVSAAIHGEYDACLNGIEQLKRLCVELFKDGVMGLEQLAGIDGICHLVAKAVGVEDSVQTYHVNLSTFTSIPDFWAIGQLFPIMPIHRLDEAPAVKAFLSDLTCDSDGKIDKFIGGETSLPLHEMQNGRRSDKGMCGDGGYYLGMFLGGAYQEALGGLHNLFGGPSVVRVLQSDGPHGFAVTRAVPGPSCSDVLRAMQHQPELMFSALKCTAEELAQVEHGCPVSLVNALARAFDSMPYLTKSDASAVTCGPSFPMGQDQGAGEEDWCAYCCA